MCLAIPGLIEQIKDANGVRTGTVSFEGIRKEVNLEMVPQCRAGDYVLVHVGVALNVINEKEAQRAFDYLRAMGETTELNPSGDEVSP